MKMRHLCSASAFSAALLIIIMIPFASAADEEARADIYFVGEIEISGGNKYSEGYDGEEGDVITIIAKVANGGEVTAENVDVRLLVDGEVKGTNTLRTIKNDTEDVKTVIFAWVAEVGEHRIKIIIDPDNTIEETNDQHSGENNNEITRQVRFEEGPGEVCSLSSLFAAASLLLLVFMFVRRRS